MALAANFLIENFSCSTEYCCEILLRGGYFLRFSALCDWLLSALFHQICPIFHQSSNIPWNIEYSTEQLEFSNKMRPLANENCRNKGSLSLIREIAVKDIAVTVCSPSTANLVHVIMVITDSNVGTK